MRTSSIRRYGVRTAALALLVFALSLQVLIPSGLMPGPGGQGLVICTGLGGTATIDDPGKAPAEKGAKSCAFAAIVTPVLPPEPTLVAAPVIFSAALTLPPAADQRPGLGLAAPPPGSTGPPNPVI